MEMETIMYILIGFIGGHLIGGHKYRQQIAELEDVICGLIQNRIKVIVEGEDDDI